MHLLLIQDLEKFMGAVLKVSCEGDIATIRANLLAEDRTTMGQVLGRLHKKFNLTAEFGHLLKMVLANRNRFVHRLSDEFDIRTEKGQQDLVRFLCEFVEQLADASHVFIAILYKTSKDLGINDQEFEEEWWQLGGLKQIVEETIPNLSKYLTWKN